MGGDYILRPSDLVDKNNRYGYIKKKNTMVKKWSEENETYIPIMFYLDIMQYLTLYIVNRKDWSDIAEKILCTR